MIPYITVTHGMRGYFAVLVDQEGPVLSGIGSYETIEEAEEEAMAWATSEERRYVSPTTRSK